MLYIRSFDCGREVHVGDDVVSLEEEGTIITNSNVDYYYAPEGYDLTSGVDVAILFHSQFCELCSTLE